MTSIRHRDLDSVNEFTLDFKHCMYLFGKVRGINNRVHFYNLVPSKMTGQWRKTQRFLYQRLWKDFVVKVSENGPLRLDWNRRIVFTKDPFEVQTQIVLRILVSTSWTDLQSPTDLFVWLGEENRRVKALAVLLRKKRHFVNDPEMNQFDHLSAIVTWAAKSSFFSPKNIKKKKKIVGYNYSRSLLIKDLYLLDRRRNVEAINFANQWADNLKLVLSMTFDLEVFQTQETSCTPLPVRISEIHGLSNRFRAKLVSILQEDEIETSCNRRVICVFAIDATQVDTQITFRIFLPTVGKYFNLPFDILVALGIENRTREEFPSFLVHQQTVIWNSKLVNKFHDSRPTNRFHSFSEWDSICLQ